MMHCLSCRPVIHRSLGLYPARNARFNSTEPQKSTNTPLYESSTLNHRVIPAAEKIENKPPTHSNSLSSRLRRQTLDATPPQPEPTLTPTPVRRIDLIVAQRRAERLSREALLLSKPVAEVVPYSSPPPRAPRNDAAIAQRRAERQARELALASNAAIKKRPADDAEGARRSRPSAGTSARTMDAGRTKSNSHTLKTQESTQEWDSEAAEVKIGAPQFAGPEDVSVDLKDIFGDISTTSSTELTASPPKLRPTKHSTDYLLRRFGGDYSHYISQPSNVYTTPSDKLGAVQHAAHILSRRQDVSIHLRQDALKIIQHATK